MLTPSEVTEVREGRKVLRAIDHPLRDRILSVINGNPTGKTVTEIYTEMRLEQSVASQHLAILKNAGVVSIRRDGKFIFYTVNRRVLNTIIVLAKDIANANGL